jgi:hypothetical protein
MGRMMSNIGVQYWFSKRLYKIMISMHLICIIPAGLLAVWQFIPVIRHKLIMLHRVNGYLVNSLFLISNIGAVGAVRRAFGGSIATQTFVGVLAIATTTSIFLGYYNIKRLQLDQHRAWMLRTWFYAGCIITMRVILIIMAPIISQSSDFFTYYQTFPCDQIAETAGPDVALTYAACRDDPSGVAAVRANFGGSAANIMEIAAALQLGFAASCWLGLTIHAVGVEIYLRFTPAEAERLRRVSYERQLKRGFDHPGSAGLTAERFGDAEPWKPPILARKALKHNENSLCAKLEAPFVTVDSRSTRETLSHMSEHDVAAK